MQKKRRRRRNGLSLVSIIQAAQYSLVWYWLRMEKVCNPELDQQIEMTQSNCWVSGESKVEEKIQEVKHYGNLTDKS